MSALTHHVDVSVVPGDQWIINGTLLDAAGAALDVTSADLLWTMLDQDGEEVFNQDTSFVTVAKTVAAQGKIRITVEYAASRGVMPGRYTDAIRAVISSIPSTLWIGNILVDADPFEEAT